MRSPCTATREWPPLATTREKTEQREDPAQPTINNFFLKNCFINNTKILSAFFKLISSQVYKGDWYNIKEEKLSENANKTFTLSDYLYEPPLSSYASTKITNHKTEYRSRYENSAIF